MGIVSIPRRMVRERDKASSQQADSPDWINLVAGGTLLAGGLLLLANQRRAGVVMGVAGATLTLLNHQETVRDWWDQIPTYVEHLQNMIGRVQTSMEELNLHRENLHQTLTDLGK
jgi:hypothetical protein